MRLLKSSMLSVAALSLCAAFSFATSAQAVTINVSTEVGAAMESEFGFRDSTITRGVDLAGAVVTATFADPDKEGDFSETLVWQAFDPFTSGGVGGDNWSLFQGGGASVFIDAPGRVMTSLSIDLTNTRSVVSEFNPATGQNEPVEYGASLFDITSADEDRGSTESTQGTSFGFPFRFTPNGLTGSDVPTGIVSVLYSGAVNLAGQAAKGDLYTTLLIDFTGLDVGGFTGRSEFEADQDTLRFAGDLRPVGASVPLPAALPMLLVGLGGLAAVRRRKRANA